MYFQIAQRALVATLVSFAGWAPVLASSSVRTAGTSDSDRTELQSQANCPTITDFANSEALFGAFAAPTDSVWNAIQAALCWTGLVLRYGMGTVCSRRPR